MNWTKQYIEDIEYLKPTPLEILADKISNISAKINNYNINGTADYIQLDNNITGKKLTIHKKSK